jgi:Uma2 family endonuclease
MATVTERSRTIDSVSRGEYVPTADQRIVLGGLSWSDFESIVAMRGEDAAGPRVTYLKGTLELMSPSLDHEVIKKHLAAIVEAYLDHLGVRYRGVGSWLLKHASSEVGLEPDECYILHDLHKSRPDLALEVVWTSGGIDKLEVYRRLGVPEVWYWTEHAIAFYVLGECGYEARETSLCVPTFDKSVVGEMLQLEALSDVRRALRERLG